ncbi:hypothetical protein [Sphaerisporangium sp. TRM90804]|uniref:hypothetical protein n=1 Tax=Sphaerisporangium sp. TRM90804 TaxID=3031113 RepID=UPI00244BE3FD|nr:hypothetical protein [Sphaerisporangium sp. TRM90804]MDH2427341.1 hypothetical protein [Sphaerisporangium sp. TRM90804]
MYHQAFTTWDLLFFAFGPVILCASVMSAAALGACCAAVRTFTRPARSRTAEEELFHRFASGEIGDEEYRSHREALRSVSR